jgi:hypothetical protein
MLYAAAGFDLLALDRACGCKMVAWVHLPRSCLVDLGDSVFVDLSFTLHTLRSCQTAQDLLLRTSMLLFKSPPRAKRCISTFHGTRGSCLTNTREWELPRAVYSGHGQVTVLAATNLAVQGLHIYGGGTIVTDDDV